ncbi:MAG: hypothetical protein IT364_18770 [Candidatus Hydrogenedentes bacterium]|nr:hypothetical protein [Candidatus Hydrogenedentota bacterium]
MIPFALSGEKTRLRWWDVAAFSFVVVTLQVLIFRYQFGTDVQVETLCQVYRKLDPAYLTRDFFVNASDQFGARSYYASLLAGLCQIIPVPITFFLLTWLSHVATIAVTFVTARRLFRGADAAGLIAACIAIAVASFSISGYCIL